MNKLKSKICQNKIFVIYMLISVVLLFVIARLTYDVYISYVDGYFYYSYLPEIFIKHNFRYTIKYPIGTALCEFPFFAIAHILTVIFDVSKADGMSSLSYHFAISVCGLCFYTIGTIFTYKSLKRLFNEKIAVLTCLIITWGTPLLVYATKYVSFSHIYTYAVVSIFLYLVEELETKESNRLNFLLGASVGFMFIIRNVNVVFVLFYLLLGLGNWTYYKGRLKKIFSLKRIFYNLLGGMLFVLPQLFQWKISTGHLILNTYSDEKFSFWRNPKIYEVLFSDAKGLFIFSPVLILFVIGLFLMKRRNCGIYIVPISALFLYELIVDASWWSWWLGGVYSIRCFLDIMPFIAIPIAAFFSWLVNSIKLSSYSNFWKAFYIIIIAGFVLCNLVLIRGAYEGTVSEFLSSWWELKQAFRL